ncbi:hypothetical protein U0035_11560 [Niabella yanshanensis]|uniref:Uncharacterized protein n=1 Tax=Niabella yanshanensis TaxID=577386 RepID=A0ABZ0W2H3_9BACT|nr:hypothetical protein [Niabella yanshanensis]WQD36300.1 hypothetical protein U0035_11560 [Niabella yanshanensis]
MTFIILATFFACSEAQFSDRNVEKNAIAISQKLDSNSIKTFKEWAYGRRGDFDIWTKIKNNSSEYSFFYQQLKDTTFLTIFRALNFQNDFRSTFSFDTSIYWRFTFAELNKKIFRITSVDNQGQDKIIDTTILTTQIFPNQNPFLILSSLTKQKDNLKIVGSAYRPDVGNFIEFWLSPNHKLVYLPDNLKINDKNTSFWEEDLKKGKPLNKNWVLIHYENLKEDG